MKDRQVSTLKIIADTHCNAPRQSSTCAHFRVFEACLLQESQCGAVREYCAEETEARETQDALTTELTACPAVEPSGERNPKYEALIKTDRRSFGFLSRWLQSCAWWCRTCLPTVGTALSAKQKGNARAARLLRAQTLPSPTLLLITSPTNPNTNAILQGDELMWLKHAYGGTKRFRSSASSRQYDSSVCSNKLQLRMRFSSTWYRLTS